MLVFGGCQNHGRKEKRVKGFASGICQFLSQQPSISNPTPPFIFEGNWDFSSATHLLKMPSIGHFLLLHKPSLTFRSHERSFLPNDLFHVFKARNHLFSPISPSRSDDLDLASINRTGNNVSFQVWQFWKQGVGTLIRRSVKLPNPINYWAATDQRFIKFYRNEKEVGEAVRQSSLKCSGVFIATKSSPVLGAWIRHTRGCHNDLSIPILSNWFFDWFLIALLFSMIFTKPAWIFDSPRYPFEWS